jgi:hypothetical protein
MLVVGRSPKKMGKLVAENVEEKSMVGDKYHAWDVHYR